MSETEIQRITALLDAASKGTWTPLGVGGDWITVFQAGVRGDVRAVAPFTPEDAAFFIASREIVADLLAEVRSLRAVKPPSVVGRKRSTTRIAE